jgi:hypothetical protein
MSSKVCPDGATLVSGPRGGTYYLRGGKKVYCAPASKEPSPPSKPSPPRRGAVLHDDWTRVATRSSDAAYDYWTVPTNTILYKGVDAKIADGVVPDTPCFYGSLTVASLYAFVGEKRVGESGKVITVVTSAPMRLIDISTSKSLASLSARSGAPLDAIHDAFGTPKDPDRTSTYKEDEIVAKFVCDERFEGFGYPINVGFHDEVMLCSNDHLKRGELEYRVVYPLQCIFEVSTTRGVLRTLPADVFTKQYIAFSKSYSPKPDDTRKTDAYLPELVKDGAKLCARVEGGYKTLYDDAKNAIRTGDAKLIQSELAKGARASVLIHTALASGAPDSVIEQLVLAGASPSWIAALDMPSDELLRFGLTHGLRPSLIIAAAARRKDVKFVKELLNLGASPLRLLNASLSIQWWKGAELALAVPPSTQDLQLAISNVAADYKKNPSLDFLIDHGVDPGYALVGAVNHNKKALAHHLVDRGASFGDLFEWVNFFAEPEPLVELLRYADGRIPVADLVYLRDKVGAWSDKDADKRDPILKEVDALLAARAAPLPEVRQRKNPKKKAVQPKQSKKSPERRAPSLRRSTRRKSP